jgi:hypothetical protein
VGFLSSQAHERPKVSLSAFTRNALQSDGFGGFLTFDELRGQIGRAPTEGGVYVVLRASTDAVTFIDANPGGRFKGRDPTVATSMLREKWIRDCEVVYIGKANNIQKRLKQYADFGAGRPVGHWGGRYVWQLEDSAALLVAWKRCEPDDTAAALEARLVARFTDEHGGRLPFANIADPSARL